jgi:thymidylate synthase
VLYLGLPCSIFKDIVTYTIEFSGSKPIDGWQQVVDVVSAQGQRVGAITELMHLNIVAVRARPLRSSEIRAYRTTVGESAWQRIRMIYTPGLRLRWKPSYIHRLNQWPHGVKTIDQLAEIRRKALSQPGSKTLSCTVLSPADLTRPIAASVPCLLAIDFKIRQRRVNLAAFFRSQDVFRFFPGDYHHLALMIRDLVRALNNGPTKSAYKEGDLILNVCSAHFPTKINTKCH